MITSLLVKLIRTREASRNCFFFFSTVSGAVCEGETFRLEHAFHSKEVDAYAELSGDNNPIHTHEAAAKSAGFDGCVVHGMLCAGLFPAVIGSHFPGAIFESKRLRFKEPVLVGERLEAEAKVLQVSRGDKSLRIEFNMECYKMREKVLVLEGKSRVIVPFPLSN